MNQRIAWIDSSKGIGILLVVLGHTFLPIDLKSFIFSFHVPLFFFISGFLTTKKDLKFQEFIVKRIKSLIVPYFIYSFIFIIYMIIRVQTGTIENVDITRFLVGVFYSIGVDNWMVIIPLWFVTCLFAVELMFFSFKKLKNDWVILIFLIILSILGYLQTLFSHPRLPWSIDIALTALVFFGIGYLCSKHTTFFSLKNKYVIFSLLILSILTNVLFTNNNIDMNNNKLGNYFDFYIAASAGIVFTIIISVYLSSSKILGYFGRNTLIILALHGLLLAITEKVLMYFLDFNIYNNIFWIFNALLTIILLVPFIFIINKYFPILNGKLKSK